MSETPSDRGLLLLKLIDLKDLAEVNSKQYRRWQNIKRGMARMGIDEAGELAAIHPEYSMWILTGKIEPKNGQISPELEETAEHYGQTGTDTK